MKNKVLLSLKNIKVDYYIAGVESPAVIDVSMDINYGEAVAVVGESGSGKSQTFLSIMGLLDKNAVVSGSALFQDQDLLKLNRKEIDKIRGKSISMIFQNPMTALTPSMSIGDQLVESCRQHLAVSKKKAKEISETLLFKVGISEAKQRMLVYPHQLSGGLRQRVMIAMALLCDPDLLIADEPTTALDVTIQAQIMDIFLQMRKELSLSIILITHDLGVVAETCDKVVVMYGGKVVETGLVSEVLTSPQHPYTKGLLAATADIKQKKPLIAIEGSPPLMNMLPSGCSFHPRCKDAIAICKDNIPELICNKSNKCVSCHLVNKLATKEQIKVV